MIRRILIKNYMAHKLTVLELSRGVTVITGPNNTGKSAIVEAIRSIAQNPPSSRTAIRHGEKSATVQIELDSGEKIDWERTEKASVYRVHKTDEAQENSSPETYAKFGRVPPEDVRNLLRLDPVETDTGPVDIHIGNQRYPIFLLDQSGSQAASFFAASTEAEYLLRMQQALKVRTDRGRARRKELAAECAEIEKELERLSPLASIVDRLRHAESLYQGILSEEKALPLLDSFVGDMAAKKHRHAGATLEHSILESTSPPPELEKTGDMERLIVDLTGNSQNLVRLRAHSTSLGFLNRPPVMPETRRLDELIASMGGASADRKYKSARLRLLEKTALPPVTFDVGALSEIIGQIAETIEKAFQSGARAAVLRTFSAPPSLRDIGILNSLLSEIERAAATYKGRSLQSRKLERLLFPPVLDEVVNLETTVAGLDRVAENLGSASSKTAGFSRLLPPPVLHDLSIPQTLILRMETCGDNFRIVSGKQRVTAQITPPPGIRDLTPLESLISAISLVRGQGDRIEKYESIHNGLLPLPELFPTSDLSELTDRIDRHQAKIETVELSRAAGEKEILRKRKQIEQKLSETDKCPLCGHAMDLAHFLEEGHA